MLQRFPVESKGRRKKLQEVTAIFSFLLLDLVVFMIFRCTYVLIAAYLAWTGWLRDNHMFYLLPHQMRNGESEIFGVHG